MKAWKYLEWGCSDSTLWEKTGVPAGDPHMHKENMQNPQVLLVDPEIEPGTYLLG